MSRSPSAPPFAVLVADPPWSFGDKLPGNVRGAEKHYDVLDQAGIEAFVLPPLADDALLFMWRVSSQPEEACRVAQPIFYTTEHGEIAMNKQTKPVIVRQGDVLLMGVTPPKASDLEDDTTHDARGLVLAEGETSGHYHGIFGAGAKLARYKATGQRLVIVGDEGATIRVVGGGAGGVDRHTPISLSPGHYEVRIQRSWTAEHYSQQVED